MEADLSACQVVQASQQVLLDFVKSLLQAFKLICGTLHSTDMCELRLRMATKPRYNPQLQGQAVLPLPPSCRPEAERPLLTLSRSEFKVACWSSLAGAHRQAVSSSCWLDSQPTPLMALASGPHNRAQAVADPQQVVSSQRLCKGRAVCVSSLLAQLLRTQSRRAHLVVHEETVVQVKGVVRGVVYKVQQ